VSARIKEGGGRWKKIETGLRSIRFAFGSNGQSKEIQSRHAGYRSAAANLSGSGGIGIEAGKSFGNVSRYTGGTVAQELLSKAGSELYYWARDVRGSSAEVDYLAVRQGTIYPVEVKSGAGGSLKSLHLMLEKYKNCPKGIVLYSGT
jgi:predicted AAA+ superfamily ATPase